MAIEITPPSPQKDVTHASIKRAMGRFVESNVLATLDELEVCAMSALLTSLDALAQACDRTLACWTIRIIRYGQCWRRNTV